MIPSLQTKIAELYKDEIEDKISSLVESLKNDNSYGAKYYDKQVSKIITNLLHLHPEYEDTVNSSLNQFGKELIIDNISGQESNNQSSIIGDSSHYNLIG